MRVALFIDGSNIYATQRMLRINIDYKKLLHQFSDDAGNELVHAYYFTAIRDLPPGEEDPLRPLLDWLEYNGFSMITKVTKEYYNTDTQTTKIKGNMDVEIAVKMMKIAPHVDMIYLFSGDGDFCSLVEAVQDMGKRVVVVSSIKTDIPMCSDDLRRSADVFIDIFEIKDQIRGEDKYRGHIRTVNRT